MRNAIAAASLLAALSTSLAAYGIDAGGRQVLDPASNRLWVLNQDGVLLFDPAAARSIEISLPDWLRAREPYGCAPDIAIGPDGEALITSNVVPTLWRIDAETLQVSVHRPELDADTDKDIGFSRLAYSREHGAFLAASCHHGSLWRIDAGLDRAQKTIP
jgi:hypothetical protein